MTGATKYSADSFNLCSEWTGTKVGGGRVDLHVKHTNWAIECLRDREKKNRWARREIWGKGGKYRNRVDSGEISDYGVLDFWTSPPQESGIYIAYTLFKN